MNITEDRFNHLIVMSRQGDKKSQLELHRAAEKWLSRYFVGRIQDSRHEDLVQDTLLSIHRSQASYNIDRPFLPWLATIARCRWMDQLRKDYQVNEVELNEDQFYYETGLHMEAKLSLQELMNQISRKQAVAIRLTKLAGYSIKEAAFITGQSESSIKINVHRGMKKMSLLSFNHTFSE